MSLAAGRLTDERSGRPGAPGRVLKQSPGLPSAETGHLVTLVRPFEPGKPPPTDGDANRALLLGGDTDR